MKLKNRQIVEAAQALRQVDNFKFSGIFRYTLAKNLRRLTEATGDLEDTRKKIIRDLGLGMKVGEDGKPLPDAPKAMNQFHAEWDKLMEAETDIVLTLISLKDLDLDNNAIPVTALAFMDCLIKEDEPKEPKEPKK